MNVGFFKKNLLFQAYKKLHYEYSVFKYVIYFLFVIITEVAKEFGSEHDMFDIF